MTFSAEITVKACPKDRQQWTKEVVIRPVGYQEKLVIELDIICECECENSENEVCVLPISEEI